MHSPVDEAGVRAARVRVERTVRETSDPRTGDLTKDGGLLKDELLQGDLLRRNALANPYASRLRSRYHACIYEHFSHDYN